MKKKLSQFHSDIMDYSNISINRIMNEISDLFVHYEVLDEDTTIYDYANRLVPVLKENLAEACNYDDDYLLAVILYSYEK